MVKKSRELFIGEKFGALTIISTKYKSTDRYRGDWILNGYDCKCDCGEVLFVIPYDLLNHRKTSCGCGLTRYTKADMKSYGVGRVFATYKHSAKKRGLDFSLTKEDLRGLILSPCYYCGEFGDNFIHREDEILTYTGIDRVNNNFGYTVENTVPCCERCNRAKLQMSQEDFFSWIELVYTKYHKEA